MMEWLAATNEVPNCVMLVVVVYVAFNVGTSFGRFIIWLWDR